MPTCSPYIRPLLIILFVLAGSSYACSQPGQFDSSFNGNGSGFSGMPDDQFFAHTSTLQADGKLIIAGESYTSFEHACLVRYNVNGSLDAGFGTGGKVKTDFLKDVEALKRKYGDAMPAGAFPRQCPALRQHLYRPSDKAWSLLTRRCKNHRIRRDG